MVLCCFVCWHKFEEFKILCFDFVRKLEIHISTELNSELEVETGKSSEVPWSQIKLEVKLKVEVLSQVGVGAELIILNSGNL